MSEGLPTAIAGVLQKNKVGDEVFSQILGIWDKTYLTLLLLARDVLPWEGEQHLEDFLVLQGHERALIKERMKRLIDLQILSETCRNSLVRPEILQEVQQKLGTEALALRKSWGQFLLKRWQKDEGIPRRILWRIYLDTEDYPSLGTIFQSYSEKGLHRFNPLLLDTWQLVLDKTQGESSYGVYETLQRSYSLRQGLLESPMKLDLSLGEKVNNLEVDKGSAHWQLQKGRFHLRKREADAGMIPLKSAFFLSQEQEESIFEIQSSMEIGNALMAKKRIDEAREYFEIGQGLAGGCGCPYWVFRAEVHEAIASFLWGDMTRARLKAAEALAKSFTLGRHEEKVFLMFLLGRCEFELGRYEKAYEYFKAARDVSIRYKLSEARSVILLWEGRAQIYRGEDSLGTGLIRRGKDGLEKQFFLSESYYFKGNYQKALSLLTDGDWTTIRENDGQISLVSSWATGMSMVSGALGSYAVLRKQSLMGDVVSHAALLGVVLAFFLSPLLFGSFDKNLGLLLVGGALAGILAMAVTEQMIKTSVIKQDGAMGISLAVFFGGGLVGLKYLENLEIPGKAGLEEFIFGQAAAMRLSEFPVIGAFALLSLALVVLLWKEFKAFTFDPDFAQSQGFPKSVLKVLMNVTIVLGIVIGLQTVGVILMVALLIAPGLAARQWTKRFSAMVWLSGFFGLLCSAAGVFLSLLGEDLPTGPIIVLAAFTLVLVSLLFAPQRGLLFRRKRAGAPVSPEGVGHA
jgi:manganese/zinc/iron transport system permease protein